MKIKRNGFTLAELLIVLIIIGILSTMMMFAITEIKAAARATQIIADMRTMKVAALAFIADHANQYDNFALPINNEGEIQKLNDNLRGEILKYIGASNKNLANYAYYKIMGGRHGEGWYVEFCIDNSAWKDKTTSGLSASEMKSVKKRLAARAKSAGLLADRSKPHTFYTENGGNDAKDGISGKYVFMWVK